MAKKDIFDRIDSRMKSQMASISRGGRPPESDAPPDGDVVEKRVSSGVIRRRARDTEPAPSRGAGASARGVATTADTRVWREPGGAATLPPPIRRPAEPREAEPVVQAPAPVPVAPPPAAPEPVAAGSGPSAAAVSADAPVATEPTRPAAEVAPRIEAPAPPAEPSPPPAVAEPAPPPPAPPAAEAPQPRVSAPSPKRPVLGPTGPAARSRHFEAARVIVPGRGQAPSAPARPAAPPPPRVVVPVPESVARAAQQASQAQQVRPAEPKKEEEKPKVVAPPPVKGGEVRSLEDVLKEQGIVQHTPKKIRRVIDDGPMPTGRISQPGGAPRMPGPPPAAGAHGPPPMGRPVYGRGPAEAPAAPTGDAGARGKKGRRRKEVVQRQEMLYGGAGARARRKGAPVTPGRKTELTTPKASKRVIRVDNEISVSELAHQMGIKGSELIRKFIQMGQMVTVNQMVDNDTAAVIASDYGYEVENVGFREEEIIGVRVVEKDEDLRPRPPVVTIMGHVDHGKTSLLDVIRKANVAAREAGGITQHIGAYQVTLKNGQQITFLDTPGHEAFTAMRARGAQVTDIVVLVVAADDGVMPQTAEAVNHAKAAGVPIIVAVNKIDKPNANPDKIKQGLTEFELVPEEWGGDTLMVPVSAKEKIGIDELLEAISLQAEILDLKANPEREARGVIIESKLDKGRGPVATVLIQHGTIKPGDFVVAGTESGKVRAMVDENGKMVKKAGPATPVEILGLSGVPNAGDELVVVEDDKAAKTLAEHRADLLRQTQLSKSSRVSYEDLLSRMKEGEVKELNLILKSDVQGSIEALRAAFSKIEVADTRINILHAAVGGITENDVTLASASRATVLGFNVRPDVKALKAATESGVEVRTYKVIYEAVDDLKKALVGMLEPTFREDVHGHAEVRNTFNIPKVGTVAGLFVTDGKLARQHQVRLLRDSVVVWTGRLSSLKRFKDDVRDVAQGYECGAGLDGFNDVKVGDVLESFTVEQVQATG